MYYQSCVKECCAFMSPCGFFNLIQYNNPVDSTDGIRYWWPYSICVPPAVMCVWFIFWTLVVRICWFRRRWVHPSQYCVYAQLAWIVDDNFIDSPTEANALRLPRMYAPVQTPYTCHPIVIWTRCFSKYGSSICWHFSCAWLLFAKCIQRLTTPACACLRILLKYGLLIALEESSDVRRV